MAKTTDKKVEGELRSCKVSAEERKKLEGQLYRLHRLDCTDSEDEECGSDNEDAFSGNLNSDAGEFQSSGDEEKRRDNAVDMKEGKQFCLKASARGARIAEELLLDSKRGYESESQERIPREEVEPSEEGNANDSSCRRTGLDNGAGREVSRSSGVSSLREIHAGTTEEEDDSSKAARQRLAFLAEQQGDLSLSDLNKQEQREFAEFLSKIQTYSAAVVNHNGNAASEETVTPSIPTIEDEIVAPELRTLLAQGVEDDDVVSALEGLGKGLLDSLREGNELGEDAVLSLKNGLESDNHTTAAVCAWWEDVVGGCADLVFASLGSGDDNAGNAGASQPFTLRPLKASLADICRMHVVPEDLCGSKEGQEAKKDPRPSDSQASKSAPVLEALPGHRPDGKNHEKKAEKRQHNSQLMIGASICEIVYTYCAVMRLCGVSSDPSLAQMLSRESLIKMLTRKGSPIPIDAMLMWEKPPTAGQMTGSSGSHGREPSAQDARASSGLGRAVGQSSGGALSKAKQAQSNSISHKSDCIQGLRDVMQVLRGGKEAILRVLALFCGEFWEGLERTTLASETICDALSSGLTTEAGENLSAKMHKECEWNKILGRPETLSTLPAGNRKTSSKMELLPKRSSCGVPNQSKPLPKKAAMKLKFLISFVVHDHLDAELTSICVAAANARIQEFEGEVQKDLEMQKNKGSRLSKPDGEDHDGAILFPSSSSCVNQSQGPHPISTKEQRRLHGPMSNGLGSGNAQNTRC